jgi:hypothetical protein
MLLPANATHGTAWVNGITSDYTRSFDSISAPINASWSLAAAPVTCSLLCGLPTRYRERTYGSTNISRWKYGLLM